jgi:hypothetical protein
MKIPFAWAVRLENHMIRLWMLVICAMVAYTLKAGIILSAWPALSTPTVQVITHCFKLKAGTGEQINPVLQ